MTSNPLRGRLRGWSGIAGNENCRDAITERDLGLREKIGSCDERKIRLAIILVRTFDREDAAFLSLSN
jgi:hypothetical protein